MPSLERWCVMVQREVADRFFAEPRTKAYGAVSVLVQLATRKGRLPRGARRPCSGRGPRVESALVAFVRVAGPPLALVRPVVEAAFAHRRKTLANSLALAGLASRERAEAALAEIGGAARVRAEELEPREFVALAEAPRHESVGVAKINLALVVGPLRADGKHEVATVLQHVDLHDDVELEPARRARRARASPTTRSCARRSRRSQPPPGVEPRLARADREAHPGRRRARRRQLRRGGGAPRSRTR